MANRAFLKNLRFGPTLTPGTFEAAAEADYNDGTATAPEALNIVEEFSLDASPAEIMAGLVAATVAQAPAGFELTGADVISPNLVSG
jgi:hypothetical protein